MSLEDDQSNFSDLHLLWGKLQVKKIAIICFMIKKIKTSQRLSTLSTGLYT